MRRGKGGRGRERKRRRGRDGGREREREGSRRVEEINVDKLRLYILLIGNNWHTRKSVCKVCTTYFIVKINYKKVSLLFVSDRRAPG